MEIKKQLDSSCKNHIFLHKKVAKLKLEMLRDEVFEAHSRYAMQNAQVLDMGIDISVELGNISLYLQQVYSKLNCYLDHLKSTQLEET